ncbi:MAG TPA: hypothetical protein VK196_06700 [Magnetospirillum sp.]|nr:hypothetical protein [Magnetospirillum sp.]
MHSSLVGRVGGCWIVEAPDGDQFVLSWVNVVTGSVPAFVGMKGVMISLMGDRGIYRRFYARWTSGTPVASVALSRPAVIPAEAAV